MKNLKYFLIFFILFFNINNVLGSNLTQEYVINLTYTTSFSPDTNFFMYSGNVPKLGINYYVYIILPERTNDSFHLFFSCSRQISGNHCDDGITNISETSTPFDISTITWNNAPIDSNRLFSGYLNDFTNDIPINLNISSKYIVMQKISGSNDFIDSYFYYFDTQPYITFYEPSPTPTPEPLSNSSHIPNSTLKSFFGDLLLLAILIYIGAFMFTIFDRK